MACGKSNKSIALAANECVGFNKKPVGLPFNQRCKNPVNVVFDTGVQNKNLEPDGRGGRAYVFDVSRIFWIVRIDEHTDDGGCRNQLTQKL